MSVRSIEKLPRYLRRLCEKEAPPEDTVLLNRFAVAHDREAFSLLIVRHGPMVLGTARRLVDNIHDAEDVFQAVFLSLARLAKSIRHGSTLPAWLHTTTCRIAAKFRTLRHRQLAQTIERNEPCEPGAELVWREVCQILDEELQRLPDRLRSPLLLCYLSGLTRDEAAKQLGWSLGTLKRRLEEGRSALRIRLERRGIATVGLALTVLAPEALQARVNQTLLESSLHMIFSNGAFVPATISMHVLTATPAVKVLAMKSILTVLAAIAIGVGIYAGTGQADPSQQVEEDKEDVKASEVVKNHTMDDPLPTGSTLRFGTSRFRYGISIHTLAVSPDGKMAFVANDSDVPRVFDLVSGRVLFTLNWGSIDVGKFSPDGQTLVFKQGCDLLVLDATTGNEIRAIQGPRTNSWSNELLEFTPDGKAIAVTSQGKFIHLIDYTTGKTIRDFTLENPESVLPVGFAGVLAIAFSPDGKRMASGGYENDKDNYFARIWDVETGKELRRVRHGSKGYGVRCLAFSPDGKTLATLGTQSGVFLRLFDVNTGNELRAFPKDGKQRTSNGSVAFSPDGKLVAVACSSIRLYDTTTGEVRLRIDRQASNLQFTDAGKTLTAAVSGAIYCWDTITGKSLTPEAADSVVEQILVTPDCSRVITRGQDSEAHIWDGRSGKHLRRFEAGWQRGMAISPDGRFLAWPVGDSSAQFTDPQTPNQIHYGSRIRLFDIAADKFVDRIPAFKGDAQDLAFTRDGLKLVTVERHGGMVRTWNFETGKEERSFHLLPDELKKKSLVIRRTHLSPDGKTAVATYEENTGHRLGGTRLQTQHVRLWDAETGKQLPELNGGHPLDKAFSPDGQLVLATGGGGNSVYETATGKRIAALPDDPMQYIRAAAFSRDGRDLAIAVPGGVIQIWDVATWTKRDEFKGYQDRSITLTFGPQGQLLAGNTDSTVLVWDRPAQK